MSSERGAVLAIVLVLVVVVGVGIAALLDELASDARARHELRAARDRELTADAAADTAVHRLQIDATACTTTEPELLTAPGIVPEVFCRVVALQDGSRELVVCDTSYRHSGACTGDDVRLRAGVSVADAHARILSWSAS